MNVIKEVLKQKYRIGQSIVLTNPPRDNQPYMKKKNHLTRRELIKGAAGMGIAGAMFPLTGFTNSKPQKKGLIVDDYNK